MHVNFIKILFLSLVFCNLSAAFLHHHPALLEAENFWRDEPQAARQIEAQHAQAFMDDIPQAAQHDFFPLLAQEDLRAFLQADNIFQNIFPAPRILQALLEQGDHRAPLPAHNILQNMFNDIWQNIPQNLVQHRHHKIAAMPPSISASRKQGG